MFKQQSIFAAFWLAIQELLTGKKTRPVVFGFLIKEGWTVMEYVPISWKSSASSSNKLRIRSHFMHRNVRDSCLKLSHHGISMWYCDKSWIMWAENVWTSGSFLGSIQNFFRRALQPVFRALGDKAAACYTVMFCLKADSYLRDCIANTLCKDAIIISTHWPSV